MASYQTLFQIPESPIREEWRWTTDVIVSKDGSEDLIPLNRYPKRTFSGNYQFDRVEDVRYHMATMFSKFGATFGFGLFQYQVKFKEPIDAGADTIIVNTARGDFRVGGKVILLDGDTREVLEVGTINPDSIQFTEALTNSYSERAIACPVAEVYSASASGFSRRNPDGSATASYTFVEREAVGPFVSPENEQTITTFDSLPLLDRRAFGTEFGMTLDTAISINDYIGLPDVFTDWKQSQWTFPLRWQCNRVFNNNDWLWWMVFADSLQGSSEPFLLPSFRSDLAITTPASGGGNQITLTGGEYSQNYAESDTFKRIVVQSDAGRHYAKISAVDSIGGITWIDPIAYDDTDDLLANWMEYDPTGQTVWSLGTHPSTGDPCIQVHFAIGVTGDFGSTLSTAITDLTPGQVYRVRARIYAQGQTSLPTNTLLPNWLNITVVANEDGVGIFTIPITHTGTNSNVTNYYIDNLRLHDVLAGDDRITFSPALPAGAGWNVNQHVEFLMKVRIADDKVTCDHYGLQTDVTMSLRTVP